MPLDPSSQATPLYTLLLEILHRHPGGLSEYELFAALDRAGQSAYGKTAFADEHTLFCRHFLLFNALYRLADDLHRDGAGHLAISPLAIRLHPYRVGEEGLDRHDALRAYYLDIRELEKISADDVMQMLGRFWSGYHRLAGRAAALGVLGLADPVDAAGIRRRYRELAMQYHPDRGGDTAQFQQLAAALRLLLGGAG